MGCLIDGDATGSGEPGESWKNELHSSQFKPYHITRRIQRMNKRLKAELGKPVAESYSRRWILTSFVQRSLTGTEKEVEEEL